MSNLRAQIEAVTFHAVPSGYLIREPFSLSSKAPHYLVNEDQKAQLSGLLIPQRPALFQISLWGTLGLAVLIAWIAMWLYTDHYSPTVIGAIAMIVLVLAQAFAGYAILRWWKLRRVRPLLAMLQPSDLRPTPSTMQHASVNLVSAKRLLLVGISSTIASTAMLMNGAIDLATSQPIGVMWLVFSLGWAGLAVLYFKRVLERAETCCGI